MLKKEIIDTDVLIIGGGTAGCFAALTISEHSDLSVLVAEKANIRRSGCLAAGVNAINAYITEGHTPQDYVDYATWDANGIVRRDLLLSMAERLNGCAEKMERLGLVIQKDENGKYAARGSRNIKINGENFKPILADAVGRAKNVRVLNFVNITDLVCRDNRVLGAVGFSIRERTAYEIHAGSVLVATGGASGLYRPNNPGFSKHKMWYPPFNTGAGYAMGLLAGAEMTSFEMRFVALRCRDTIAPTGTLAQCPGVKQINARGEVYEDRYAATTSGRAYGTVCESLAGRGPCYLKTSEAGREKDDDLLKAYLNMAPSQTLRWVESGKMPSEQDTEIACTEPYIVGGHTASGYWVDTDRETTVSGLYAAGDVAGGCPQKYVTGALAEAEIAAFAIMENKDRHSLDFSADDVIAQYEAYLAGKDAPFSVNELEEAMQKTMDAYAGGISAHYCYNETQLALAEEKIRDISELCGLLSARDMHELMFIYELKERLTVCLALIAHLRARKETRWHTFNENADYPDTDENYFAYVNSVMRDGKIATFTRPIVTEDRYEHKNQRG